jgi:hypothetical protein
MDRSELKRRALWAAMSATLAFGCRATDKADEDCLVLVDGADTDRAAEETDLARAEDTSAVDSDPAVPGDGDPDPATGCAPAGQREPDCVALGLDIEACCDALRTFCGTKHAEGTAAYNDCVFGPGFDGSTGCIPWGPPVPPAARRLA